MLVKQQVVGGCDMKKSDYKRDFNLSASVSAGGKADEVSNISPVLTLNKPWLNLSA